MLLDGEMDSIRAEKGTVWGLLGDKVKIRTKEGERHISTVTDHVILPSSVISYM